MLAMTPRESLRERTIELELINCRSVYHKIREADNEAAVLSEQRAVATWSDLRRLSGLSVAPADQVVTAPRSDRAILVQNKCRRYFVS